MKLKSNPLVDQTIIKYPKKVQDKLDEIRNLILSTAEEIEEISVLEETLKWGEPSYLSKIGSTVRMDWKPKNPNQVAIYFKCTSKLVPTFRSIFGDSLKYENNRAILLDLDKKLPTEQVKTCISMALRYHKIKNLELLGYQKN